jgi:uncharacterized protein
MNGPLLPLEDGPGEIAAASLIELGACAFYCDTAGCLYWPEENCLVVADLHLEKGSSFARRGQMLPPYDTRQTLARLARQARFWNPARIVALGDSFHDDGAYRRTAASDRDLLASIMKGREWLWLAGNHDPAPPADIGGDFAVELAIGDIVLRHQPAELIASFEISGHLHPQARIVRRGKAVRRRCFATDRRRLIMPSFGAYTGGLNIRDPAFAGLFAQESLRAHLLGKDRVYEIDGALLV